MTGLCLYAASGFPTMWEPCEIKIKRRKVLSDFGTPGDLPAGGCPTLITAHLTRSNVGMIPNFIL